MGDITTSCKHLGLNASIKNPGGEYLEGSWLHNHRAQETGLRRCH